MKETDKQHPLGKVLAVGIFVGAISAVAGALIMHLVAAEADTAVVGGVAGGVAGAVVAVTVSRMRGTGGGS